MIVDVLTPRLGASAAVPPLTPDAEEARRLAEQELSNPLYDIAEPTLIDRIARAVAEFFTNLFSPDLSGGLGPAVAVVATIVVVVLIVLAFIIWGVPRATRRSALAAPSLFDGEEERSAAELRSAAEAHAKNEAWDAAVVMRMRAIARACVERGVVAVPPGATVHTFARAATRAFPDSGAALNDAADTFDDVRYLRRPGTSDSYRQIAATDDAIARTRPARVDEALV